MLTINVSHDLDALASRLTNLQREQLPFAAAKALTMTVQDVQHELQSEMPSRFTIRRTWTIQGIRIKPATKRELTAAVYSRDPFMDLQESGGTKAPIGRRVFDYGQYLAVPLDARRTKGDVVKKEDWPQNLIKPFIITLHDGRKFLCVREVSMGKRGPRRVSELRKGATQSGIKLMYTLVPKAEVKARLGLHDIARRLVPVRFPANFNDAMAVAIATAR